MKQLERFFIIFGMYFGISNMVGAVAILSSSAHDGAWLYTFNRNMVMLAVFAVFLVTVKVCARKESYASVDKVI